MSAELSTDGNAQNIQKAQACLLTAREALVTARSHLKDDGRLVLVIQTESVVAQVTDLLFDVGGQS